MSTQNFLKEVFNSERNFIEACHMLLNDFFGFSYNPGSPSKKLPLADYLRSCNQIDFVNNNLELMSKCPDFGFLGTADEESFNSQSPNRVTIDDASKKINSIKYDGLWFFCIEPKNPLSRTELAQLTRAFNRGTDIPVVLFVRFGNYLSMSSCERSDYKNRPKDKNGKYVEGEKLGRVTILKDIDCSNPHRGHCDILDGLKVYSYPNFDSLFKSWLVNFSISTLNNRFYSELQDWFYWATDIISLPCDFSDEKKNKHFKQSFLVRLLSRLMFCWFLKEKKDQNHISIIESRFLELTDQISGDRYHILNNINSEGFLEECSYYRAILQNIFFCALNSDSKSEKKDFLCTNLLPKDFDYNNFTRIPFLNGSTFRPLDDDFVDGDIFIPNSIFYGDNDNRGINQIFRDYKFTIEENTPVEEDIALDPELLGMVFENLLAEIDPQNDEGTARSIRNATGSFYTPRPVIQEMTNESLHHYLTKYLYARYSNKLNIDEYVNGLIFRGKNSPCQFDKDVVDALYKIRILDPACGSGAFPMGMLQRIVDILRLVDSNSGIWLDLMLEPVIDPNVRDEFKKQLETSTSDYQRKLGIIRNCIYAIDIQPIAVQITKLRFFISLLADQDIDTTLENCGILPFPNMETKIICADSLKNLQPDLFIEKMKSALVVARGHYYQPNISPKQREDIASNIAQLMSSTFPKFANQCGMRNVSNEEALKRWFLDANINAPFFDVGTFFPEIKGGFDIVIGNPPYGGFKITQDVRDALELGSNDPYGAFISRFLGDGVRFTPLKEGGMLAFIVSDTFMTIGSHLKLRKQIMNNKIHKMIRMCPKTFSATVNTVIVFCEKCILDKRGIAPVSENICTMADMTNIDIHENYQHFVDVLSQSMGLASEECIANEEYAIYRYPQTLISNCSNYPFFVASPKLFGLMNDRKTSIKGYTQMAGRVVQNRTIQLNGNSVLLYKLGDISQVKQGLATGDNDSYLFQLPEVRGSYRDISPYSSFILTEDDLSKIHADNTLRKEIIEKGFSKNNPKSRRYFGGRYIVKYDKGGESNAEGGWLPNYYVPTSYFFDWSEWAINRLKTLTIADRIIENEEKKKITEKNKVQKAAVIRSPQTYFQEGIAFSWTGQYSPTFRKNEAGPYDHGASAIFIEHFDINYTLAVLCAKLSRYIMRTMINHTVNFGIDDMKDVPFIDGNLNNVSKLVEAIISKQKNNKMYDYASLEQKEIDNIIYHAYGLSDEDIKEVEMWYARRYPKLSQAQKNNLSSVNQ